MAIMLANNRLIFSVMLLELTPLVGSGERWRSMSVASSELVRTRYDSSIIATKLCEIHCTARECLS